MRVQALARHERLDRVLLVRAELSECADKLRAEEFTAVDLIDGSVSLAIKLLVIEHGWEGATARGNRHDRGGGPKI